MKQQEIVHIWQEYQGGPNEPPGDRLHVTLNRRGLLLNRKVFDTMGRPARVKLLFDYRNQAIGVRAAGRSDQKPFPVRAHPKGSHRGKPFCRHYKILPQEPVRFTDPRGSTTKASSSSASTRQNPSSQKSESPDPKWQPH